MSGRQDRRDHGAKPVVDLFGGKRAFGLHPPIQLQNEMSMPRSVQGSPMKPRLIFSAAGYGFSEVILNQLGENLLKLSLKNGSTP